MLAQTTLNRFNEGQRMQPEATINSTPIPADRDCLQAWRRNPDPEHLRPLLERYGPLIYGVAYRRARDSKRAGEVTRTVFLVLARRARKLRKNTILVGWLFYVTTLACRKMGLKPQRIPWWRFVCRRPKRNPSPDATLWIQVSPEIDETIQRFRPALRDALLLCVFLNQNEESVAQTLNIREHRARKRVQRALGKVQRRLRKRGVTVEVDALTEMCSTHACAAALPEGLLAGILETIAANQHKKPAFKPARRTLAALAWARWRRRFAIGIPASFGSLLLLGAIGWHISARTGHSRFISEFVYWRVRHTMRASSALADSARPWPSGATKPQLDSSAIHNPRDLYQTTNIWVAHLSFTREQAKALEPRRIGPMPNFARPDGMWLLRNPQARRSGLLGVLGFEFDWTHATFEFGNLAFTNVAARVKGNVGALYPDKPPFKLDLNKFTKGQKLAGLDELTFNNLFWDYSYLSDALGYELFRDAGVPSPRTAYVWLSTTIENRWQRKPLGLYLLLEPVGAPFLAERFGSKKTALFKPVTYELFDDLGNDWSAYAGTYDVKTQATREQQGRVMDFARLVSKASDTEFTAHAADFLDLDEFARFLACQVLLSNYDSILSDGQNFYMYLDPHSNKLGFIPWDLDAAWGIFWLGSKTQNERASIWHPWVGKNRFIERVMALEEFRKLYRAHLEDFLARLFVPGRLHRRIDEMAIVLREPIAAESSFRLDKFEQATGLKPVRHSPDEKEFGINRPVHELKRFIEARAKSVRQQLDGKSSGVMLKPPAAK